MSAPEEFYLSRAIQLFALLLLLLLLMFTNHVITVKQYTCKIII